MNSQSCVVITDMQRTIIVSYLKKYYNFGWFNYVISFLYTYLVYKSDNVSFLWFSGLECN